MKLEYYHKICIKAIKNLGSNVRKPDIDKLTLKFKNLSHLEMIAALYGFCPSRMKSTLCNERIYNMQFVFII